MSSPDRSDPSLARPLRARPSGRCPRPLVCGTLILAGLFGCDRNIEPYQPGEEPREPDLARIFPGPPTGMAGGPAGAERAALPPSRTEGAGGPAAGESGDRTLAGNAPSDSGGGQPISGRIEVAPELAGEQPEGAILFVIARPQGARGGPPLAVLRIEAPEFPFEFEIGPGDVMIPSMRFEGPISLSARLDADGNAMTRGGTDLSSAAAEPISPGTTGVALVLAQKG